MRVARAFSYEPPTPDMINALGVLTQYVTVIEQPQDRETPRKPAQVPVLGMPARLSALTQWLALAACACCRLLIEPLAYSARACRGSFRVGPQGSGGPWLPSSPVVTGLPGAGGRAFGAACAPAPARLGPAGSPAAQVRLRQDADCSRLLICTWLAGTWTTGGVGMQMPCFSRWACFR